MQRFGCIDARSVVGTHGLPAPTCRVDLLQNLEDWKQAAGQLRIHAVRLHARNVSMHEAAEHTSSTSRVCHLALTHSPKFPHAPGGSHAGVHPLPWPGPAPKRSAPCGWMTRRRWGRGTAALQHRKAGTGAYIWQASAQGQKLAHPAGHVSLPVLRAVRSSVTCGKPDHEVQGTG